MYKTTTVVAHSACGIRQVAAVIFNGHALGNSGMTGFRIEEAGSCRVAEVVRMARLRALKIPIAFILSSAIIVILLLQPFIYAMCTICSQVAAHIIHVST